MKSSIDQEWEHNGVLYWLSAEVHVPEVEVMTGDMHSRWATYEPGRPEVLDVAVLAWDAADQGYEHAVEEPRVLAAARRWAEEYVR